jgi:hypothetical protein
MTVKIMQLSDKLNRSYLNKTRCSRSYVDRYFPKINNELSEAKYIRDYAKKNNIDLNLIEELALIRQKFMKFMT